MCLCQENHWCRTWEETQDGKYPIAEHAPECDEYKTEEFTIVEHDKTWCIMEKHEAESMDQDSEEDYNISPVFLTRDQFEKLPEFDGF